MKLVAFIPLSFIMSIGFARLGTEILKEVGRAPLKR